MSYHLCTDTVDATIPPTPLPPKLSPTLPCRGAITVYHSTLRSCARPHRQRRPTPPTPPIHTSVTRSPTPHHLTACCHAACCHAITHSGCRCNAATPSRHRRNTARHRRAATKHTDPWARTVPQLTHTDCPAQRSYMLSHGPPSVQRLVTERPPAGRAAAFSLAILVI